MRNFTFVLCTLALISAPANAHEFWIEPQEFVLPAGGKFEPQVRVGEHLGGRAFPFAAGGYEMALWVGPKQARELNRDHPSGSIPSLEAMGDGLHVLAVASLPQLLVYESEAEFREFADEIRAQGVLADASVTGTDGRVRESYRRFSKTLVFFGEKRGEDKRVGLAHEWVKSGDKFTLFSEGDPVTDQPVTLFCRTNHSGHQHIREHRLRTDDQGSVAPALPLSSACLVNAVFLEPGAAEGQWKSDWVSLFLGT